MDDVTRLLCDLVAIPSVNPMGRPLSGPEFFEPGVTDYLERLFRDLGVPCERQTVAPGRDNLLARYEAPGARRNAPLRRPSGHGADRRHDDRAVRARRRERPAVRPRLVRRQGRHGGDAHRPSPGWCRERPRGSASVVMACTVDEEFTHTGSSRLAASAARCRPGDRRRADPARPRPLPQGRGALEDPHPGRRLPQLDAAPGRQRHLPDGARSSSALPSMPRELCAIDARPDARAAQPVGRPDRGGAERQRGSRLVRDRGRPPADPGRRPGRVPASASRRSSASGWASLDGIEFAPPWVNMPPLSPDAGRRMDRAASAARWRADGTHAQR